MEYEQGPAQEEATEGACQGQVSLVYDFGVDCGFREHELGLPSFKGLHSPCFIFMGSSGIPLYQLG